jgi:hypothetical protein
MVLLVCRFIKCHTGTVALARQNGGAFGFALIFWFFCIKTKEQ